jgi:hypothetical protein
MNFIDFQIRAWQDNLSHIRVLVHSSPVGGMRKPVTVPLDVNQIANFRQITDIAPFTGKPGTLTTLIDLGKQLSQFIFPRPVFTLLVRSLERIAAEDGLRIRLCLDEALIDLPWEFLYRPDASDPDSLTGFLVLNDRVSLVREVPIVYQQVRVSKKQQRMVFVGALWDGKDDKWEVEKEYHQLSEALEPVKEFLGIEYVTASEDHIEQMLMKRAAIFHYSGHTDIANGQGYIIQDLFSSDFANPPKFYSETLSALLRKAQTRLAVFSACNSGRWYFVKPLILKGIPVIIGTQGIVSNRIATAFCQKLYASLAIGMSLDEAVTWARFHVLEINDSAGNENCEWGSFMVYMPAAEAVLFPRPQNPEVRERQKSARNERRQTIINVYQNIGSVQGGQVTGVSIGQLIESKTE